LEIRPPPHSRFQGNCSAPALLLDISAHGWQHLAPRMKTENQPLLVLDFIVACLAVTLWVIIGCACQINLRESPVNGIQQGSSYSPAAIGNPDWVAAHPGLAASIGDSSFLNKVAGLMRLAALLVVFLPSCVLLPICIAYLAWRMWKCRRAWIRLSIYVALMAVLIMTFPFLDICVEVLLD
jgi:hypothetical protein